MLCIPGLHDRAPLRQRGGDVGGGHRRRIPGLHDRAPLRQNCRFFLVWALLEVFPVFMTGLH